MHDTLLGAQIQKITQPNNHSVIFRTYRPGESAHWLCSAHPQLARICQTFEKHPNPARPPHFCLWLRNHLINGRIYHIEELHPQAICFEIRRENNISFLVWENNLRFSNLLLLDDNKALQTALLNPNQTGRSLPQGATYQLPAQWTSPKHTVDLTLSPEEIDATFYSLEQQQQLQTDKPRYQRWLKKLLKKTQRRLQKQEQDLEQSQQYDTWKQWGELLKSQQHQIQPWQTEITVTNYFDPQMLEITIPLNPEMSAAENMAHCFRKAQKQQKAIPHIEKRIFQTMEDLEFIETQQSELDAIDTSLEMQRWLKQLPKKYHIPESSQKSKVDIASDPMMRQSSHGDTIVIGRNQNQNDYVTFQIAKGNHWWFHAQGVSGSHVVVLSNDNPLHPQTLHEAAALAAYYSKGRGHGKVEVDYVQRKYVRKLKGGAPGQVLISQQQSVLANCDKETIQKILQQPQE